MWTRLLSLSIGFVFGAVAILAVEALLVYVIINRLQHNSKKYQDREKEAIRKSQEIQSKSDIQRRQSLEFKQVILLLNFSHQFCFCNSSLLEFIFLLWKLNNNYKEMNYHFQLTQLWTWGTAIAAFYDLEMYLRLFQSKLNWWYAFPGKKNSMLWNTNIWSECRVG